MAGYAKDLFSAGHAVAYSSTNSITVYVYASASTVFDNPGANYCNISCNGVETGMKSIGSSGYSYTFTGLQPGTGYTVVVDVLYSTGYSGNFGYDSEYVVTESAPTVTPWSWTTAERNAFNNKGEFTTLTAARWNAFVDKVNETCLAANSSWLTNYSTVAGAKASSGGALTANMFNSVKFNIGSRASTGIADVSAGSTVYGSYFITLENKLNSWIATL